MGGSPLGGKSMGIGIGGGCKEGGSPSGGKSMGIGIGGK